MTVATEDENENCYLKKVEIWNVSLVSKLVPQQKWYQDLFRIIRRDWDLAKVEELINVIQRVDDDLNRDVTPAEFDCCCDGHCNLTPLPGGKMADIDPFSTLIAANTIPYVYPEAEDDEVVDDVPLPGAGPGEKDDLYAVLTTLETKFDLDVCPRRIANLDLSSLIDLKC